MNQESTNSSIETLQEIRSIMERSARFLTLSGWSGVWAGCVALAGAAIAYIWLLAAPDQVTDGYDQQPAEHILHFLILAVAVLTLALAGVYFFTLRKNQRLGIKIWNTASRKMLLNLVIPLAAGALLIVAFVQHGHWLYIAPACLIFYGFALINGSRYTVADVRYLGLLQILLGGLSLLFPAWGLYLWATGFGMLHILYGIIMWHKYD